MITSEMNTACNLIKSREEFVLIYKQKKCKYVWRVADVEKLKEQYDYQQGNFKSISSYLNGPSPLECKMKWQSLHPKNTLSRQLWSQDKDEQLKELVQKYGKKQRQICLVMNWRTRKQVREHYLNQLQGPINNEKWAEEEDKIILRLYKKFGTRWSRPENMIKRIDFMAIQQEDINQMMIINKKILKNYQILQNIKGKRKDTNLYIVLLKYRNLNLRDQIKREEEVKINKFKYIIE